MDESLQEYIDSRGVTMRVDRELGVLRGVKILGFESRNGRTYLPEALAGAMPLYEGAKVNVNHPKGSPSAPRDYQDRIGVVRHVVLREREGMFGDFFFNPKHPLAGQLAWDAEHAPENVGFSHNVQARLARRGEQVVVEAITRVQSVDLVADPATTRGLFESAQSAVADTIASLTLDRLKSDRPDLVEAIAAENAAELAQLRRQVDQFEATDSLRKRRDLASRLLAEYNLPTIESADSTGRALVSQAFVESLLTAHDENDVRQLIADRARLIQEARHWAVSSKTSATKPQSRDQQLAEAVAAEVPDAGSFVRAIT
ncbi:MAG TPA: hypothetical protein VHZ24_20760 [Pirellulales bacterium]|jgi:hypothetical protein|nr:hypothetical protein [Pirellulales bacterium]